MDTAIHSFHIPVMGIAYTIDTPAKVARFGISSVISIVNDRLIEQMREFYCHKTGETFEPITDKDIDHRAKRITAYLDLMQRIVDQQVRQMKSEPFEAGKDIVRYFEILPDDSEVKKSYLEMLKMSRKAQDVHQQKLRESIVAGAIDVNIMTKLDNLNYAKNKAPLPEEYRDAMSALRGFGQSQLTSSVVFSAGLNPRLYNYLEKFPDFFPDASGRPKKKIILKVSDFRSAMVQGKYLAKKGLWVSEFRIESGLNCGGHAFPTHGLLMGPILEEFKQNIGTLRAELLDCCNAVLEEKQKNKLHPHTRIRVTCQGGIGTAKEDRFLRQYYNLDGTGWGSPFLLVPEASNVDDETLQLLKHAQKDDYYLSHASPFGVPYNNFRKSSSEKQRKERIEKSRPGSPCYLKYLAFNTEFTETPICQSSREYQQLKLKELADRDLPKAEFDNAYASITEKDCLCEGLSAPALLKNKLPLAHRLKAVNICPGPNLAYFSNVFSLEEMIGHIYGRISNLNLLPRQHLFINELTMYLDYFMAEVRKSIPTLTQKQVKYFEGFQSNLLEGIAYYKHLVTQMEEEAEDLKRKIKVKLDTLEKEIRNMGSDGQWTLPTID